jgi:hypothetical protein
VRQINLGFDFFWSAMGGAGRFGCPVSIAGSFEVPANQFGFVLFNRTGMGFLLGDADCGQCIENGFALNFQFSG